MIQRMSRRLRRNDELRFFLHWLRRPGQVGALVPSGTALAAALVAEIDIEAPGVVVELGPGTGRVTQALLAAGVEPEQLVAIERNAAFCRMLRQRFPGIRIVPGEARSLSAVLQGLGIEEVKAVASSLPLLSMKRADRRAILSEIAGVLQENGVLVQYTYGMAPPVPRQLRAELGVIGERTNWVVANLPPASVWRYRRNPALNRTPRAA